MIFSIKFVSPWSRKEVAAQRSSGLPASEYLKLQARSFTARYLDNEIPLVELLAEIEDLHRSPAFNKREIYQEMTSAVSEFLSKEYYD